MQLRNAIHKEVKKLPRVILPARGELVGPLRVIGHPPNWKGSLAKHSERAIGVTG